MKIPKIPKIFKISKEGISLKLLALFLSFILWVMATNYFNPEDVSTFNTKLIILNQDILRGRGYVLANQKELEGKNITLNVRGSKKDRDTIKKNQENISVSVDLKSFNIENEKMLGEKIPLNLEYKLPLGFSESMIVSRSAHNVEVILDEYLVIDKPVTVSLIGEVAKGYVPLQRVVEPEVIKISGAKSIVNNVDFARIEIDIKDATNDVIDSKKLIVYDKNNKDITSQISLDKDVVDVKVPVNMFIQSQINSPKYSGTPGGGYYVKDIIYNPKYVELVGNEKELEKYKKIDLDVIDVSDKKDTFSKVFDIRKNIMDSKLSIRNGSAYEVEVTIVIKKDIEKEFQIPIKQLEIIGNEKPMEIDQEYIFVKLRGLESLIESIDSSSIKGSLDLSEYSEGSFDVTPNIITPVDTIIVGEPSKIRVTIFESILQEDEMNTD